MCTRNHHHPAMKNVLFGFLALWVALAAAKIADIDKPIPVTDMSVVHGNTARLECDLHPQRPEDSAYLVLWYIESQKQPIYSVDLRSRPLGQAKHWADARLNHRATFVTTDVTSLLLANVTDEDSGVYRCRVDFRHSPTRHFRYKLNIVHLPKVPVIEFNSTFQFGAVAGPFDEGSDLTLRCRVVGGGADVRVSWWQDDRELDSSRSTSLVNNYDPYEDVHLNHLLLRHLARSDHGSVYSCKASVHVVPPIAPISSNITLNVRLRPLSVEITSPVPVLEAGKAQQIQCRTSGANPPALVTWWVGNKQLIDAPNEVVNNVNGTVATLTLNLSMDDDGRTLTCRVQTPQLSGSAIEESIRMQVYYPPRVSLGQGRHNVEEIREGMDIYLDCHVRANPPFHRLVWLHNGKQLNGTRSSNGFISNQSLVLRSVKRQSIGNYTCIAANRQGETASNVFHLDIKYAPVCRRSRPLIVVVSRDQTAHLRCEVEADPADVSFRWTLSTGRETALVTRELPTDSGLSSTLEYTPRREADFGQLLCWARNAIGNQQEPCVFNIVKEGLPPMPTQCELSSLSKGTWEVKCRKLAESSLVSGLLSSKSLVDADPPRTDEEDQGTEEEPEVIISSSSLVYWLELYDAETGQLLRNVSHAVPRFSVAGIDPGTRVAAVVTSANRQGRSEPVRLEGAVERAVGSRAANEPEASMTTVILLAAPGALLLAIVILAVILALYQRQRKRTLTTQRDAPPAASASVTCGTAPQPHQAAVSLTNEYNRPNRQPDLIKSKRGSESASTGLDYQVESHSSSAADDVPPPAPTNSTATVRLYNNGSAVVAYHHQHQPQIDDDVGVDLFPTVKSPSGRNTLGRHEGRDAQPSTYVYR